MNIEIVVEVTDIDEKLTRDFIDYCCEALSIKPESILVGEKNKIIEKDSLGMYCKVEEDTYIIDTSTTGKTLTEIYKTIAHELVRVKQYEKNRMSKPSYIPPDQQKTWDIEAERKSYFLVKEYVDILKEMV